MSSITQNMYGKEKNRSKVIFQKGKIPLDAEINEAQDILDRKRQEVYDIIKAGFSDGGFQITESGSSTTQNFAIAAGTLYNTESRYNNNAVEYTAQATDYTFQTITPSTLTTPSGDRTDLVFLEVWIDEVDSSTDSTMKDSTLNIETAVRDVVMFAVKVAVGTTTLPSPVENSGVGTCYELAYINRLDSNASILTAMIVDRRHEISNYQSLIYEKRANPFKVVSTAVNVLNDDPTYGIQMISLSNCGGDREYFVSSIVRNDSGTSWKIIISDSVEEVSGMDTSVDPTGNSHIALAPINSSDIVGFVVVDWSILVDGTDETFTSTELIIRDAYCNLDYSAVAQDLLKNTPYRGALAKVYPVSGDSSYIQGTLYKRNQEVVTVAGLSQNLKEQEQEYPVSRIDDRNDSDVTTSITVPNGLSEASTFLEYFTPASDIEGGEYNNRAGFYLKSVGTSGGSDLLAIAIHDSSHVLQGVAVTFTRADLVTATVDNWVYVNYPVTLTKGQTYHYHFYTTDAWGGQPELAADAGGDLSYRQFYKPLAGKSTDAANNADIVHVLDYSGAEVVSDNASTADDMSDITDGFKRQSSGTNYDYMAVDFSNTTVWENWAGYEDFIGVDLATGRIKLPSGLALDTNDLFVEFNTKVGMDTLDTKSIMLHSDGTVDEQSLDDYLDSIVKYDYVITTQAQFDTLFNGTALDNSIFLKDNGTPYNLTYAGSIQLKDNVKIYSDGATVNRADAAARFHTTYKAQTASSTFSFNDFTVADSSGFVIGDIVHHLLDNKFYQIESIPDSTSILVNRTITGTPGASTISSCVTNIHTEGWTFDGQNNINGLGGSLAPFSGNGGAFNIQYCSKSKFIARVTNSMITVATYDGGAYYGDNKTFNIIIKNIDNCTAGINGGGAYQCNNSEISNIDNCFAVDNGGGAYQCNNSEISNVINCGSNNNGGGAYQCNNSEISNVITCEVIAGNGGGVYQCNDSKISNITNNSAPSGNGGGAYNCIRSIFLGDWTGNTAGTNDQMDSCTGWATCFDGTTNFCYVQGAAANTINWDNVTVNAVSTLNMVSGNGISFYPNAAANLLDDYEEGTWTPNVGGNATYGAQIGYYQKIGNMVFVECWLEVTTLGTGSASNLDGLPFTSKNNGISKSGSISYVVSAENIAWLGPYMAPNGTTCAFIKQSVIDSTTESANPFGNGTKLTMSMSYLTE